MIWRITCGDYATLSLALNPENDLLTPKARTTLMTNGPNLHLNPENTSHSTLVAEAVCFLQPRNGTDYSTAHFRAERERVAVNVHLGNPPLEGVR